MAGRWAHLAVTAHLQRSLDFSAYRDELYWPVREEVVLSRIEQDLAASMNELGYEWHVAAAQNAAFTDAGKIFRYHRRQATRVRADIGRARLPWYTLWNKTEGRELAELWKEMKEHERDPQFAALLKKSRHELTDLVASTAQDVQEQKTLFEAARVAEARRRAEIRTRRLRGGLRARPT